MKGFFSVPAILDKIVQKSLEVIPQEVQVDQTLPQMVGSGNSFIEGSSFMTIPPSLVDWTCIPHIHLKKPPLTQPNPTKLKHDPQTRQGADEERYIISGLWRTFKLTSLTQWLAHLRQVSGLFWFLVEVVDERYLWIYALHIQYSRIPVTTSRSMQKMSVKRNKNYSI